MCVRVLWSGRPQTRRYRRLGFAGAATLALMALALNMYPGAATATTRLRVSAQSTSLPGDEYGSAVAISGPVAVVGAFAARNLSGAAYIFARTSRGWTLQTKLVNPEGAKSSGEFGESVAVAGDTAVVGAWGNDGGRGVVYVYVRSGGAWHRQASFAGTIPPPCDLCGAGDFGEVLAISGNLIVISEPDYANFSGAVFIYARLPGGKWRLQAKETYPGGNSAAAGFGEAVAVWGTTVAVGAPPARGNRGAVFTYTRPKSSWSLQSTILGPTKPSSSDPVLFGSALTMSGATLGIAEYATNRNSGIGFIYKHSNSGWRREAELTTPAGKPSSTQWITSLAISGPRVLIGAPLPSSGQCGAVYEYLQNGASWHKRAKLVNPGCTPNDEFGNAVALSGQTAVIGAEGFHNNAGQVYVQTVP